MHLYEGIAPALERRFRISLLSKEALSLFQSIREKPCGKIGKKYKNMYKKREGRKKGTIEKRKI